MHGGDGRCRLFVERTQGDGDSDSDRHSDKHSGRHSDTLATLDVNVFRAPPSYLPEPPVHSSGSREGRLHPVPHGFGRWDRMEASGGISRQTMPPLLRYHAIMAAAGQGG